MTFTTVEDDEVRQRPVGTLETPIQNFCQHTHIIVRRGFLDSKMTIKAGVDITIVSDGHGGGSGLPAKMGNIVHFDTMQRVVSYEFMVYGRPERVESLLALVLNKVGVG